MATINGKPSIFVSVPHPHKTTAPLAQVTYEEYVAEQVADAAAMAEWIADDIAQAEYQQYLSETQAIEAWAAEQAAIAEYKGCEEAIAGHDIRWQQGGN